MAIARRLLLVTKPTVIDQSTIGSAFVIDETVTIGYGVVGVFSHSVGGVSVTVPSLSVH